MNQTRKQIPESIEQYALLKINFSILKGNYVELANKIRLYKTHQVYDQLWNYHDSSKLDDYIIDVSRLLLNFILVACSVKDSCRKDICDWYEGSNFLQIYKSKVDESFSSNDLIQFVEDLRNVTMHCYLPVVNARGKSFPKPNNEFDGVALVLRKIKLLQSISKKGEKFLLEQNDSIDIEPIIREYFCIVEEFYNWLLDAILNSPSV